MSVSEIRDTNLDNVRVRKELRLNSDTHTMSGNETLVKQSPPMMFLDPAAARNLTLPAEANSDGLTFIIVNTANAAEDITVLDDAAATVCVIGQNEMGMLVCDGATWRGMVTATGLGASTQNTLQFDLGAFVDGGVAVGTPLALAIWSSAADPTPGIWIESAEAVGIRWNNHATPDEAVISFVKPMDLDTSKDVIVHILSVRSATDATDLITWDVGAFDNVVGAAMGADADFGGTSSAMTDDVNIQESTVTLAAADISSTVGQITLTVKPTDGLLATIDVTMLACWIEYSKKVLTS